MAGGRPHESFPATLDTAIEGFSRVDITDLRYHRVLVNDTPTNRIRRKNLEDALLLAQDHNGFTRDWFACFICCQLMPDDYFYYGQTHGNFELGGVQEKDRQCYDCISAAADQAAGRVWEPEVRLQKIRRKIQQNQIIKKEKAELVAHRREGRRDYDACFCDKDPVKCRAKLDAKKKHEQEMRERYGRDY